MSYDNVKPIRLSFHALEQCKERGTNEEEVKGSNQVGAMDTSSEEQA